MPSGSHRGSRGSHSSGGSRGGSFSSRSYGGSSSRHHGGIFVYHGRPRRFRFGRHYYIYTGRSQSVLSLFVFLVFFLFIGIFFTSIIATSTKQEIALIEEDYAYYQDMIDYAKDHEDEGYIVDATVTGKFYHADSERYHIEYRIRTTYGGYLDGYTYASYTVEEAANYRINSIIKVAVDSVPITILTDSINMDYENMPLERDGEYLSASKTYKTTNIIRWVLVAIVILMIVILIWYGYKKKELADENEKKEENEKIQESTTTQCRYCGSTLDKTDKKCPNCGAGLR